MILKIILHLTKVAKLLKEVVEFLQAIKTATEFQDKRARQEAIEQAVKEGMDVVEEVLRLWGKP